MVNLNIKEGVSSECYALKVKKQQRCPVPGIAKNWIRPESDTGLMSDMDYFA